MFQYLLKGILAGLAIKLLNNYRQLSLQLLKIEAAKGYLQGVQMARLSAIGLLRMGLFIALIGVGVLLLHAGLFILLPWSVAARAVLGMCLGLAYVVIGCVALHAAMSEKSWMQKSGAADMLADATGLSKENRPARQGFDP
jgi:hypothetical protein